MKNTLKKILSLITVAVILLSTLLMSASAASEGTYVTDTFTGNFSTNPLYIYDSSEYEGAREAFLNLEIYYVAPGGGIGLDVPADYSGKSFTIDYIAYGGDWTYSVRIVNNSYWSFPFNISVPGTGSVGTFEIPASSNGQPGEFLFNFSTVLARFPSARMCTFWFNESLQPVNRHPDLNTNYAKINIYTGSTLYATQKVYAPQNTIGSWSSVLYELENDGSINLPDVLNGYKIDKQEYGLMTITVDPDKVNTYNVYYDMKINDSYTILYAVTPNGRKELYRLYAPSGWTGDYVYEIHDLAQDDDIIPTFVDGYSFNYTVSPEYVTVYADRVVEYDLYYTDIGADKTIKINYYDQNGKVINQVEYRVSSLGSTFKIPSQDGYLFAPSSVSLTLGLLSESFYVYMIDFTGERVAAYQKGLADGLLTTQKDLEAQLNSKFQEGYDKGFDDGYADGSEITGKERSEIMSDYNAITGFFDGLFNAIFGSIDIVFNGVALGGVTLGTVIWTLVIIVIVVVIGGKLL